MGRPSARMPTSWGYWSEADRPFRQWVSEDRRSRAARSRGPQEIAVVGCGFSGVGWGAWAPKIRRQFGINHLGPTAPDAAGAPHRVSDQPATRARAEVPW